MNRQTTYLDILCMMADDDIEALTKAIITFETGLDDKEILDTKYNEYLKSDIDLLGEFFYEYKLSPCNDSIERKLILEEQSKLFRFTYKLTIVLLLLASIAIVTLLVMLSYQIIAY